MDALDARPYDLDIAAQVPHSPVRVFVMGERGVQREPATEADNAAMAELAAAGIRAGALGFSTSRTLNHKTLDGRPIPTLTAAEDELTAIGAAMGSVGAGWLQVISDFVDLDEEFAMLRRVVERCRRTLAITILQVDRAPDGWRRILDHIARGEPRRPADHRPDAHARNRRPARLRDFHQSVLWVGRAGRRSPICRSRRSWRPCGSPRSAPASSPRNARTRPSPVASPAGTGSIRSARRRTTSRPTIRASPPSQRARGRRPRMSPTTTCWSGTARRCSTARSATTRKARSTPWARCCGTRTRW